MANERTHRYAELYQRPTQERLPREYFVGKVPKGFHRADDIIKDEVWMLLMREEGLDLTEIEIDVKEGAVTLTGTVSELRMKHQIPILVSQCLGVKDVINDLHVLKKLDEV